MKHADEIRAMTDEQLARYLTAVTAAAIKNSLGVEAAFTEGDLNKAADEWLNALQQEIRPTPPKEPLCLSCAHANISVTDDFADCLCAVRGGYEGGKTECKDYERKQRNDGITL